MKYHDLFLPSLLSDFSAWQLGNILFHELQEGGIVFIFCSEERGAGGKKKQKDFSTIRKELYKLSKSDFKIPICDLGDLILGNKLEDTHCVLQEVLVFCERKNIIPIVVGGSNDLSFSLFKSLTCNQSLKKINYSQLNPFICLEDKGKEVLESNFLAKILSDKTNLLGDYFHLGYQRHLNDIEAIRLVKEIGTEALSLSEIAQSIHRVEPFLRRANLVTINCDVVEGFTPSFSINSQINGLNRREICAYMKEVGLGEDLKMIGIFNYNFDSGSTLNDQLLAQMLWYLLEGINIQRTHPKKREYETFIVLVDNIEYTFQRDVFANLWYFGEGADIAKWMPCSEREYENAKKGMLSSRFYK